MYKKLLLGGCVATLMLAAGFPVRSQTMQQAPASQEPQQAPASQEPQQAPASQGQQTPQSTDVSSEDLQKFASAIKQILAIQEDYQGRMAQAVEQEGLSQERYMEIQASQSNPSAQPSSEITAEERQNYEQANVKISQLQQEAESKMKEAVQAQGLDIERFNQIFAVVEQDPSLQQQVQQMIQN
jgi:Domain of unknown function (DUF4168)